MNLGFTAPGFLLLAFPAIGFLIFAYLNRGQAKRQFVSSTIIFKQLKNRPNVREKVKLPWRFFYELLLLTLLLLAIAGFYWQSPGKYWQVIIDNSLSLSAVADASSSRNILALNIAQLKNDRQDRFKNLSGIKVCLTAPSFQCWSEGFESWEAVSSKLNNIPAIPANDSLESVLGSLTIAPKVNLTIYSDYLSNSRQSNNFRLSTVRTGELGNLAITEIISRPNHTVSVGIQAFVSTPIQKKVKLYSLVENSKGLEVAEIKEANFKANPEEKVFVDFKIFNNIRAVIAEIDPAGISSAIDAISADNISYQVINQQVSAAVLLVSKNSLAESGLEAVFPGKLKLLSPEEYQAVPEDAQKYSLIIFDNYIPSKFPSSNHLIVASNAEPGVLETTLQRSPKITSWDKESSLLRYLSPDNFSFKNVWSAKLPSWFQPVITSNNQTILATGFQGPIRSIYWGFPLLPLEKSNNQALAILSLNAFKWLEEESQSPLSFQGETLAYVLKDQQLESEKINGNWELAAGIIQSVSENKVNFIAKNFYSEEESNLLAVRKIALPILTRNSDKSDLINTNPNLNQLIWLAWLMLLASFFIWRKGKAKA